MADPFSSRFMLRFLFARRHEQPSACEQPWEQMALPEHNPPTGHLRGTSKSRRYKPAWASNASDLLSSTRPSYHATPPLPPAPLPTVLFWKSYDTVRHTGTQNLVFSQPSPLSVLFSAAHCVLVHWIPLCEAGHEEQRCDPDVPDVPAWNVKIQCVCVWGGAFLLLPSVTVHTDVNLNDWVIIT